MKKHLIKSILILVVTCLLSLSSCGYQFQGAGTKLPDDIKTVSIEQTENDTTTPGLGLRFTESLRTRFERYGVVKVVDVGEPADAILKSRILSVDKRVRNVTGNTDIALEMELVMIISAELKKKNGQVLWRNPALTAAESFASTSDVVVTSSSSFAEGGISSDTLSTLGSREVSRGQEEAALEEVVDDATRRLYLDAVAADF